MLTYEDYKALGEDEAKQRDFILRAIGEHKRSDEFKKAEESQTYYDGENPTIMKFEKILYDMAGKAHVDIWSANHKIASQYYPLVINQEVAYLLGNGVFFSKNETKQKLGKKFDLNMLRATLYARVQGSAFVFWNQDHTEVFRFDEFKPIYSEESGALMMGIRYWKLADNKPLRVMVYELDGYTSYIRRKGEKLEVLEEKQPYKVNGVRSEAEGARIISGENYDGFPIVPLYANKDRTPALRGKRNTIDALDLAMSNMVNNVDEGNLIYWVLINCGGMDDLDDAKFIEQLKTTHVTHADGDAGAKAEAHSIEAPFAGTDATIERLEQRLYKDFQAFNPEAIIAKNQSATAIKASYIPLDLKCDIILEPQVSECILGILALAGINDEPTYERNQLINALEETQRIIMQAQFLDEEYTTKKLLAINGDADQYDELVKRKDAEAMKRTRPAVNGQDDQEEEEAE